MSYLLVAHGTRKPEGVAMIGQLAERVSEQLDRPVHVAFVDVVGPTPEEVLRALPADRPVTVVPAFLASGYHVRVDLPAHVVASGHPAVIVTDPLGPCTSTVAVLAQRLIECGWRPGDSVVLAAAGTSDARWAVRHPSHCCDAVGNDRRPGRAGLRGHRDAAGRRRGEHSAQSMAQGEWSLRHTCWRTAFFKIGCATAAPISWPIR